MWHKQQVGLDIRSHSWCGHPGAPGDDPVNNQCPTEVVRNEIKGSWKVSVPEGKN